MKIYYLTILLVCCLFAKSQVRETVNKNAALKKEILKMDSLLFNVGFNKCDTTVYKNILSDNFEFYDDRSGLNSSKQSDVMSLIQKCAAKDNLTRVLSNCIVDKLGDFGAVQLGEHYFILNGINVGSAKFVHVWEKTNEGWKLKRVISYNHVSTHK